MTKLLDLLIELVKLFSRRKSREEIDREIDEYLERRRRERRD